MNVSEVMEGLAYRETSEVGRAARYERLLQMLPEWPRRTGLQFGHVRTQFAVDTRHLPEEQQLALIESWIRGYRQRYGVVVKPRRMGKLDAALLGPGLRELNQRGLALNVWVAYAHERMPSAKNWGIKQFLTPVLIRKHAPFVAEFAPPGAMLDLESTASVAELVRSLDDVEDRVLAHPTAWQNAHEATAVFNSTFFSFANFQAWYSTLSQRALAEHNARLQRALQGEWVW